jgi:hypothetical protein
MSPAATADRHAQPTWATHSWRRPRPFPDGAIAGAAPLTIPPAFDAAPTASNGRRYGSSSIG